jgi:hypothetical protein
VEPSSPAQKLRQVFKGLAQDLVRVLPGFPGLFLEVFQHPPHEPFVYFEVKLPRRYCSLTGTPRRVSGQRKPGERPPRAAPFRCLCAHTIGASRSRERPRSSCRSRREEKSVADPGPRPSRRKTFSKAP